MQPQTRKQMIQKVHIGKSMLKMTDEQYKRFFIGYRGQTQLHGDDGCRINAGAPCHDSQRRGV